jgi:hypothetical protein
MNSTHCHGHSSTGISIPFSTLVAAAGATDLQLQGCNYTQVLFVLLEPPQQARPAVGFVFMTFPPP